MKRLTEYTIPETGFSVVSKEKYKRIMMEEKPSVEKVYNRLKKVEDILGDEYDLDRLRELAEADREGRIQVKPKMLKCPRCGSIHLAQRVAEACYYCFDCGAHIMPSAPVRHGYWMDSSNGWTCSECCSDNIRDTKWCPNCGAKMDRKVPD